MPRLLDLLKLLFLFIALGWSANFAVKNIKYLGAVLTEVCFSTIFIFLNLEILYDYRHNFYGVSSDFILSKTDRV